MKTKYIFYAIMALCCVLFIEWASILIQKGISPDDIKWCIGAIMIIGIVSGRLSIYIEYKYNNKNNKKTRNKKS